MRGEEKSGRWVEKAARGTRPQPPGRPRRALVSVQRWQKRKRCKTHLSVVSGEAGVSRGTAGWQSPPSQERNATRGQFLAAVPCLPAALCLLSGSGTHTAASSQRPRGFTCAAIPPSRPGSGTFSPRPDCLEASPRSCPRRGLLALCRALANCCRLNAERRHPCPGTPRAAPSRPDVPVRPTPACRSPEAGGTWGTGVLPATGPLPRSSRAPRRNGTRLAIPTTQRRLSLLPPKAANDHPCFRQGRSPRAPASSAPSKAEERRKQKLWSPGRHGTAGQESAGRGKLPEAADPAGVARHPSLPGSSGAAGQGHSAPIAPGSGRPGWARLAPIAPGSGRPGRARSAPIAPGSGRPGRARSAPIAPGQWWSSRPAALPSLQQGDTPNAFFHFLRNQNKGPVTSRAASDDLIQ